MKRPRTLANLEVLEQRPLRRQRLRAHAGTAVDEIILQQRGKELGYTMNDEQFKNIVDQIRKENKLEDDATFKKALESEGMTEAELKILHAHYQRLVEMARADGDMTASHSVDEAENRHREKRQAGG